jgi:hypothetical protein
MSRSGCRCLLSGALRREHSPSRLRNLSRCAFSCALCVSLRFSFQRSKRSPVFGRRFGLPKLGAWFEACKFFLCSASFAVSKPFGWSRLSCESGLYSGPERVVQAFLFRLSRCRCLHLYDDVDSAPVRAGAALGSDNLASSGSRARANLGFFSMAQPVPFLDGSRRDCET